MANIYPPTAGIEKLRETNVGYWTLCISRSQYSEAEINNALEEIAVVNLAIQEFLSTAYDLLEDENGPMNRIKGFATKEHEQLKVMLCDVDYVKAYMSQNSHSNCLPVAKWQKEIKTAYRQITKIQKFINNNLVTK